jgi:hypothetical protein
MSLPLKTFAVAQPAMVAGPLRQELALLAQGGRAVGPARNPVSSMSDSDITAIAFLVLLEEAKAGREDLKSMMDDLKKLLNERNDVKQRVQQVCNQVTQALVTRRTRHHWP